MVGRQAKQSGVDWWQRHQRRARFTRRLSPAMPRAARGLRRDIRLALARYGLPPSGALFDNAYAYVAENY